MRMIRFNLWAVVLVMAVVFAGCKKTGNYYDVIPADSQFVLSANVQDIMQKGDVNALLDNVIKEKLSAEPDAAMAEKVGQFFTDPQAGGLALNEKMFVFFNVENNAFGYVAKVKDEAKVGEFFEMLQKDGKCKSIDKKSGYTLVHFDDNMYGIYNAQLLQFYSAMNSDEAVKTAEASINRKAEESIASKVGFRKMLEAKGDICGYGSLGKLYEQGLKNNPFSSMMAPGMDISKLELIFTFNFETGKLVSSMEYFSEDATVTELFKKQAEACGKPTNVFLPFFPASTLIYGASNMDGKKYWQFAEEYKLFENLKLPAEMVDFQKLLSSIKGDIAFGLTNMSPQGMPSFALYAEVTDTYLVNMLAGLQSQFGGMAQFTEKGQNAYEVSIPMLQMTIWFGMHENFFYLTDDAGTYANLGKKSDNPLSNNQAVLSMMANSYGGYFVNVGAILELPMIQAMSSSSADAANIYKAFSTLDYLEFSMKTPQMMDFVVASKDQQQNILKTWIEQGKEFIK